MIIIYTSPNCTNCKDVKLFLENNNIKYEEKDITTNFKAKAKLISKGLKVLPVVQQEGIFIEYNNLDHVSQLILELIKHD